LFANVEGKENVESAQIGLETASFHPKKGGRIIQMQGGTEPTTRGKRTVSTFDVIKSK
jgi:hypothetical protein